jgi:CDP-glucose 4,6-dehydratase
MTSLHGDVRDAELVERTLREHRPEIVMHLAAQPLVRRSYEAPLETYQTNVLGTAAVLDALRTTREVRAAVIVTSDKCYDLRSNKERYAEEDSLGGYDPYSSSKAAAEFMTAGYRASYWMGRNAVAVATARAGNVIGGGDWSRDRLLPDLVSAFSEGRPALIREPNAIRPWQHVLDPLRGYLMLAERLFSNPAHGYDSAWNFGPPAANERPVGEIADTAARVWGSDASWKRDATDHLYEAPVLRLDSAKAAAQLGWRGRIPLDIALKRIVSWYRSFFDGADARALMTAEIDELVMHVVGS